MSEHDEPWRVVRRKVIYRSPWINVYQDTVVLPDGTIIPDHHVLDYPFAAVGVVPVADDGRILLVDHYRFITRTRGWEIPAGAIDPGEDVLVAAARELREETAYQAREFIALGSYYPSNGSSNQVFHILVGRGLVPLDTPIDGNEILDRRWFTPSEVEGFIMGNHIHDGLSLTGLLWAAYAGYISLTRR
jgi:8-oxo-dGTP pyrophosphatase MutT (NUDIX family)